MATIDTLLETLREVRHDLASPLHVMMASSQDILSSHPNLNSEFRELLDGYSLSSKKVSDILTAIREISVYHKVLLEPLPSDNLAATEWFRADYQEAQQLYRLNATAFGLMPGREQLDFKTEVRDAKGLIRLLEASKSDLLLPFSKLALYSGQILKNRFWEGDDDPFMRYFQKAQEATNYF
ncbi:hypothetical protein COY27_02100 [Candidatus Woesearchaeota archaeon CG_4_10_14_0_2_um_filter_33_13]|nr:MAG: hypothetical protein COY27_02100 [Candidatus Woesearchaeota archaeon CG_4_10_14_0_2_um_filter_33_13]